jgi:plasmid stabilization system protein ParE
MDFRVELSDQAQRDIAAIYDWLRSHQAGDAGERWFVALRTAIASPASLPWRCPLAPENRDSPVEVRQLVYGERPHVYRTPVCDRRRGGPGAPHPTRSPPTSEAGGGQSLNLPAGKRTEHSARESNLLLGVD